ncbi:hypothetical protein, partial [Streptomyces sp. NRRL F-2305]|uniref:hypothetical protein n=1 Tax=Streptomyces sp. NRRL F-2305 TaxID=1463840 RepID=UPI0018FF0701
MPQHGRHLRAHQLQHRTAPLAGREGRQPLSGDFLPCRSVGGGCGGAADGRGEGAEEGGDLVGAGAQGGGVDPQRDDRGLAAL